MSFELRYVCSKQQTNETLTKMNIKSRTSVLRRRCTRLYQSVDSWNYDSNRTIPPKNWPKKKVLCFMHNYILKSAIPNPFISVEGVSIFSYVGTDVFKSVCPYTLWWGITRNLPSNWHQLAYWPMKRTHGAMAILEQVIVFYECKCYLGMWEVSVWKIWTKNFTQCIYSCQWRFK